MNINPIFPASPNVGIGANVAATTNKDGTTADKVLLFTAGTNGSYVRKIRFKAMLSTVAGIARVWLNNGTDATVATNNSLIATVALPAIADIDAADVADVDIEINEAIPAGYRLYLGAAGVSAANTWQATVYGGDY